MDHGGGGCDHIYIYIMLERVCVYIYIYTYLDLSRRVDLRFAGLHLGGLGSFIQACHPLPGEERTPSDTGVQEAWPSRGFLQEGSWF